MIYLPEAELKKVRDLTHPVWDRWIADMEAKGFPGKKIVEEAVKLKDKCK